MASCLGLYIETNLIKYAKVTKDRDIVKVEAFGVKICDKIGEAIDQIVAETYSYKTPISINLSEETYQYFYFFNLLNKNDLKKAIETEFESYCSDKNINPNALERRYALVEDIQDKEKIKAIYISANKSLINKRIQELEGNNFSYISSLPVSIANIVDLKQKENIAIVNIEENTTITTILDEKIYEINKMDLGMGVILDNINAKENSYSKAYEICKNTTIYTMEGKELIQEDDENIYLEDIMPTLYNIVNEVKKILEKSLNKVEKIYLTGTGCVINNIDLYFQEFFTEIKCEILKPYFIPETIKINMKDYIEVNSAIALAMQGLGYGLKNLNFKKPSFYDNMPDWLKLEIGNSNKKEQKKSTKFNFNFSLRGELDKAEKWLIRSAIGVFVFIIIYTTIMTFLKVNTNKKTQEISKRRVETIEQIELVDNDIQKLNNKTSNYERMIENLKSYSDRVAEKERTKNVIPTLLSEIMYIIPQGVEITSIENTTGDHIVINAQSQKYELLGYLKGKLITDGILSPSTVVSTSGVKQNNMVMIVIEGDLP